MTPGTLIEVAQMVRPPITLLTHVALLVTAAAVVTAMDCETNVKIKSVDDTMELRESCVDVEGEVSFGCNVTGNINPDGLGTIRYSLACQPYLPHSPSI